MVHRDPESCREDGRVENIGRMLDRASAQSVGVQLRHRPVRRDPGRVLGALPGEESVGVIVIQVGNNGRRAGWWKTLQAASLARRSGRPVLLSRGSHPYRRILVPARRTPAGRAAVRVAIDMASFAGAELHGPAVVDPVFISGVDDPHEERNAISWLEEEAAIHGVPVHGSVQRGNPVRVLRELGEDSDLIVLGIAERGRRMSLRVGIAELVAKRTDRSVLFVPATEAA
jgi:nucleotide-binding universal stress UspA family protein